MENSRATWSSSTSGIIMSRMSSLMKAQSSLIDRQLVLLKTPCSSVQISALSFILASHLTSIDRSGLPYKAFWRTRSLNIKAKALEASQSDAFTDGPNTETVKEAVSHQPSELGRRLKIGVYFVTWWSLNVVFSIYNKKVLNAFPYPWLMSTLSLAAGFLIMLSSSITRIVETPKVVSSFWKALAPVSSMIAILASDGASGGMHSEPANEAVETNKDSQSFLSRVIQFQDAFWRFLRPHTIRGTIIGTIAVVARALSDNPHLIDWGLLPKALQGLLALLCGNGYIVGINQIYDIDIDKVNKPFLPVAAGDLSIPVAWTLVLSLASVGISIVASNFGPFITGLYSLGLFLGAIYSVPPLRLKRFAVAAFLIIATVRGFLLNFGVYYATRGSFGLPFQWSPPVVFITIFVTMFATVIAITKDLPDVEGDRKFQISTFATKLGVRSIAFLGSGLLLANYVGAIVAAYVLPQVFRRGVMVTAHVALGAALVYQTIVLDAAKCTKDAISAYYRFIWNLFYLEYALFPLI